MPPRFRTTATHKSTRGGNSNSTGNSSRCMTVRQCLFPVAVWLIGLYVGSLSTAHYYHSLALSSSSSSETASTTGGISISSSFLSETLASSRQQGQDGTGGPKDMNRLAASQEMVQKLQAQLEQYERERRAATGISATGTGTQSTVCARLFGQGYQHSHKKSMPIPTAMSLWTDWLEEIHAASQLKINDPKYAFSDFTAQLLQFVTPRLPQSVLSVPAFVGDDHDNSQWAAVGRVLEKAYARWHYVTTTTTTTTTDQQQQSSSPPPPPPIKMVILGGSVLVGRNCRKLVKDLGLQLRMPQRECT
jgi:hypothetical protein